MDPVDDYEKHICLGNNNCYDAGGHYIDDKLQCSKCSYPIKIKSNTELNNLEWNINLELYKFRQ